MLGVSFRPPSFNAELCAREGIGFHLLSDEDRSVMKLYGAHDRVRDCARRVSFLIDQYGVVRAVDTEVKPVSHGPHLIDRVWRMQGGE